MIAAKSTAVFALVFATTVLPTIWWNSSKHPQIVIFEKGRNDDSNTNNSDNLHMLRRQFQSAKEQYINLLNVDYGADNVQNMFMTEIELENGQKQATSVGRTVYQSPNGTNGPSWDRLVRKVAKKILQSHLQQRLGSLGTNHEKNQKPCTTTFVWASGGHSAAAGHGNFFNESYTAVLGRNAKDMFAAVGLDFQSRNMGMGGTPSGQEMASCTKEIFGTDMDVLSWDYGMLDGRGAYNFELYFHRASLSPSRPACIGLRLGSRGDRLDVFRDMEQRGLTTLMNTGHWPSDAIPDSANLTLDEVKTMPKYIQSLKCNGKSENGEPTCAGAKWNMNGGECDDRPYKTSWHPGWKKHALDGNIMTLFLMEIIDDALQHIQTHGSDPALLLRQLQEQEDAEYQMFLTSGPPLMGHIMFKDDVPTDVSVETIYKGPNICHTARLPSQTRYLGILTDRYIPNDNGETPMPYNYDIQDIETGVRGPYNYDIGIAAPDSSSAPNASYAPNPDGEMRLTYNARERHHCAPRVHNDYKDWFMAHGSDQQGSKLVIPNAAEEAVYMNQQKEPLKGIIALCFCACAWGRCPEHSVNRQQLVYENAASMQVNGIAVANYTFMRNCILLRDANGGHVWKPNAHGKFEISTRVHNQQDFMRVSSFIIW